MVIPAALEAYDFSGIDTLVDIAGGHGHVLMSVLKHIIHDWDDDRAVTILENIRK